MDNRSRSQRKRRRVESRPPDRFEPVESTSNWRFTTWDQDCGHPRLIELIGAWMFVAPMLFICLAITVSGIVSAPFGLLFGVPAGAIGYFVFWRPMWRLQQRYLMFDEDGVRRRPATHNDSVAQLFGETIRDCMLAARDAGVLDALPLAPKAFFVVEEFDGRWGWPAYAKRKQLGRLRQK